MKAGRVSITRSSASIRTPFEPRFVRIEVINADGSIAIEVDVAEESVPRMLLNGMSVPCIIVEDSDRSGE